MKCRELEEIILFGDGFGGAAAIGTRIAGLGVVDVELVEDAVLAGVAAFIDVAVLAAALEQILHHVGVMVAVGGALEAVDAQAEHLPLVAEFVGDDVGEFLRRFARRPAAARSTFCAVLVGAGGRGPTS